jgi:hypothetical protein
MITRGGFRMSVAMTNCGALGWVTDRSGYHYDPIDPESGLEGTVPSITPMLQTQKIFIKKLLKDVQVELKVAGVRKRANTTFIKEVNSDVLGMVMIGVSAGEGGHFH